VACYRVKPYLNLHSIIVSQCTVQKHKIPFIRRLKSALFISNKIVIDKFKEGIKIVIRTWIITEFEKWVIKYWHGIPKIAPKFTVRFISYGYCAHLQKLRTQSAQLRDREDVLRFPAGRRNFSLPKNCAQRPSGPYSFIFSSNFGSLLGVK